MHEVIVALRHWSVKSLNHYIIHGPIASSIHCFVGSLVHSVSCASILSFQVVGITTKVCLFVDAPPNFNISLSLHRKDFPVGHLFLITISFFGIFRFGMGRTLFGDIWCMWALGGGILVLNDPRKLDGFAANHSNRFAWSPNLLDIPQ